MMMPDDKDLPKPEDLGEGPERRMQNFPPKPHIHEGLIGGSPGTPKPDDADAVGDDDTEELVEDTDEQAVQEREENTQKDNARVPKKDPRRPGRKKK